MGVPCAEIFGNHSKGLPVRFYTLWAKSGQSKIMDYFIPSLSSIGT